MQILLAVARCFSLFQIVQTLWGAHPALYIKGNGDYYPGDNSSGHEYPHLGLRLRIYGAKPPLPYAFMACKRITSLLLYTRLCDISRRLRCPRACYHLAIALSVSTLGRRILRISIYEVPMLLKMSAHDIMLANRLNGVFYVLLSLRLQI
jgi:hypothetical protein